MVGVGLGEPTGHPEPPAQTKAAAELHPESESETGLPSGSGSPASSLFTLTSGFVQLIQLGLELAGQDPLSRTPSRLIY